MIYSRGLRTTRSAAVVLFLLLSPALVRSQTAVPDKQSDPAHGQQTEQSGSTGASASQSDAGTQAKPQGGRTYSSTTPGRPKGRIIPKASRPSVCSGSFPILGR